MNLRAFIFNQLPTRKKILTKKFDKWGEYRLLYLLSGRPCRIRESKNAEKRGVDVDPAIIRISTFKRLDPTFVNSDNLSSSRTFTREASVFSESFSLSVRLYPWSYKKEMNNINLFYQTLLACIYKKATSAASPLSLISTVLDILTMSFKYNCCRLCINRENADVLRLTDRW